MTARDRTVVVVVLVLALIVGSWLLVIQPKRDQASKLGDQIKSAQSKLATAQSQVLAGEAAKSSYAGAYASIARLGEAVPADDDVPSLIYQLQNAANVTGVDFRSLKLDSSAGTTSTATPAPTSTSAAQSVTATLPPGAAVGPAGFPILPFTFDFQGNFFHLSNFFLRLQKFVVASNKRVAVSGRLMSLNSISFAVGPKGFPQIIATIGATTYIVPASQGLLNGGTSAGPGTGSSTTQAASTTGGSTPTAPAVVAAPQ